MEINWVKISFEKLDTCKGQATYAKITSNENSLHINLVFEDNSATEFSFDSPLAYMVSDEGQRLKTLNHLLEKYGNNFLTQSHVFIVENSRFLKWFLDEGYDLFDNFDIKHYVFVTATDIIDVLSVQEPTPLM